ncbi:uncharacterized protein LOC110043752 [Orbicella faveolata]|uniref:uncharacterized protein LOC110043752 n=1 Tax=Orbicella faveolata TaxID=48498 RepID=UPI0009E535E8|nr:uncharacterized protein LOC110043752 [Orbicella faveolata]
MEELDGESNKDIHGIKGVEPRKKCPAYGSVCLNCQRENHWARVCRSRSQGGTRGRQRNRENRKSPHHSSSKDQRNRRRSASGKCRDGDRRDLSDQFETITFESITVDFIGPQDQPANEAFLTVNVDLHSISSRPTALKTKLAIIGLPTSLELNLVTLNCSVQRGSPLNANRTCEQVTPIKDKDELVKRYPDCFDGVGRFQGQYHITVVPSVPPVVHTQRRMPLSLRDYIKEELDDMESRGIITKIKEGKLTAWVNSLVYSRKPNGKLRLCLDPKDRNKTISREHHMIPTLEEILLKLSGAKYFSIVDAKCGYWNVVLDQELSYLRASA